MPASADVEVSASVSIHATADFYAPLEPAGVWVDVGSYGRCWHPSGVAVGWRLYCDGYWVWTDCGWYWVSDEPWAWACYHYGWWVYDGTYGWVWAPGVEWAPAWVSWRVGGGFIGWAPCSPPGGFFHHTPDSAFVFVGASHFGERIRPSMVVNDARIIRQTRFIANTTRVTHDLAGVGPRKVVFNQGPGLAAIQKASGKEFVTQAIRADDWHGSFRSGNQPAPNRAENRQAPGPAENGRAPQDYHSSPVQPPAKDNGGNDRPSHGRDQQSDGGSFGGGEGHGFGGGRDRGR